MPYIKAMPSSICQRRFQPEPLRKIALCFLEQGGTNSLALGFRRHEKLIENMFLRQHRQKTDNISLDDCDFQAPAICQAIHNSANKGAWVIKDRRTPVHFSGAGMPNFSNDAVFVSPCRSYFHNSR